MLSDRKSSGTLKYVLSLKPLLKMGECSGMLIFFLIGSYFSFRCLTDRARTEHRSVLKHGRHFSKPSF